MDNRFGTGESYWEASQRVRETFARHELANVLNWAFGGVEIVGLPDDELEDFRYGLAGTVRGVEPAWALVAEELASMPLKVLRAELREAFTSIRGIAHAIANLQATAMFPMTVRLYAPMPASDRDGRPRWMLRGRLADALIWGALKLFSEVPRSLIRTCALEGCSRIYVAGRNQRYCFPHQMEAHRQTQRRAEGAFRERQRAKKVVTKKKKGKARR